MKLDDTIKQYVQLTQHPSKRGWYPVVCKVCGDHGKKGPRAAFIFDNGNVGYNCFNDSKCNASYKLDQHEPLSRSMERLLAAYGIPDSEWEWINFDSLKKRDECGANISSVEQKSKFKIHAEEIELLPCFVKLTELPEDDMWRVIAEDYLTEKRNMNPSEYPYYVSTKDETFPDWKKWYGRLIIPIYNADNKLIFYQGRDLTGKKTKKYLNPDVDREAVLFGLNETVKYTDEPIYIVEGFFDAYPIGGVAVFGNKLTDSMLFHLNRSNRPKVVIPDQTGDGYELALQALKEGWMISTPDISNCKDVNEAIIRFGKLYTMMSIAEHTCEGFEADLNLRMFCPDYKGND